jgi:hypothetical protein
MLYIAKLCHELGLSCNNSLYDLNFLRVQLYYLSMHPSIPFQKHFRTFALGECCWSFWGLALKSPLHKLQIILLQQYGPGDKSSLVILLASNVGWVLFCVFFRFGEGIGRWIISMQNATRRSQGLLDQKMSSKRDYMEKTTHFKWCWWWVEEEGCWWVEDEKTLRRLKVLKGLNDFHESFSWYWRQVPKEINCPM